MNKKMINVLKEKKIKEIIEKFKNNSCYLKNGSGKLSKQWKLPKKWIIEARNIYRSSNIPKDKKLIKNETKPKKRLFFDIETSPNIVFSWNVGNKIQIGYDNILTERSIICICYKWEHEKDVKFLTWDNGNDYQMLKDFIEILNDANEIIGHNSDSFDIKWLRTRCLYYNIPMFPTYQSLDTYKLSKKQFRFNSNRLDYIGKFLGYGGKIDNGGINLWKNIVLKNDINSMKLMLKYCAKDVLLLENIFNRFKKYVNHKTHFGSLLYNNKKLCPECSNDTLIIHKHKISASGIKKIQFLCTNCGKYHTTS